ncbi:MAG: DNA-3-methyladenine glycosylase I [Chromatiales bacterium]
MGDLNAGRRLHPAEPDRSVGTLDIHTVKEQQWQSVAELPAKATLSDRMSKDLKQRGFNFVGSTICYAFMQTIGMVTDHTTNCFRYAQILALAEPAVPGEG